MLHMGHCKKMRFPRIFPSGIFFCRASLANKKIPPHINKYQRSSSNAMASCTRCGATMEGLDAGGNMLCDNCEAAMHSTGSGTDVPCQRCGMYLPSHELQMWNSRLYCSYCIMDLKDEDRMGREQKKPEAQEQPTGGLFGGRETDSQPPSEKGAGGPPPPYPPPAPGPRARRGRGR